MDKSNTSMKPAWERSEGSLDAVTLQRTLRQKLSEKLESLSQKEQFEFLKQEARKFFPQFSPCSIGLTNFPLPALPNKEKVRPEELAHE
jgi:hypothetical protein